MPEKEKSYKRVVKTSVLGFEGQLLLADFSDIEQTNHIKIKRKRLKKIRINNPYRKNKF